MTNYHYVLACMYAARLKGWDIGRGSYMEVKNQECCAIGAVIIAERGAALPSTYAVDEIEGREGEIEGREGMKYVAIGFDYSTEEGLRKLGAAARRRGWEGFDLGVEMGKAAERRGWIKA